MDGLVEELLRLESAKHKALVEINATAYDANVRKQRRLLAVSKGSADKVAALERVLALSQLITLNTRLLQNLTLTTSAFAFRDARATKTGISKRQTSSRAVEA